MKHSLLLSALALASLVTSPVNAQRGAYAGNDESAERIVPAGPRSGVAPQQAFGPPRSQLGMNMAGFDFTGLFMNSEIAFADVMKQSRSLRAVLPNENLPAAASSVPAESVFDTIDENGYITEGIPKNGFVAFTQTMTGLRDHYPAGRYIVSFDGNGTLNFGGDETSVTMVTPNRYEIVTSGQNKGIIVRILTSDPAPSHVRNLRIVHETLADVNGDPIQTFQPQFLARLAGLRPHALRFVNWRGVSSSTVSLFSEEALPSHITYQRSNGKGGVPWQVLAELCAELGADLWANLPYDAEFEGYVRPLAQLLAPWSAETGLAVRVEYGNEVWNPTFGAQYCYAIDNGGCGVACTPENPPGLSNAISNCIADFVADRSDAIFGIFEEEFGLAGVGDGLIRVIGGRINRTDYTLRILDRIGGPDEVDVFALNSFFGARMILQLGWFFATSASDQDIVDYLHSQIEGDTANLANFFRGQQTVVDGYNDVYGEDLVLNAYEGGQSLTFSACDCPGYCPTNSDPVCTSQILLVSQKFNDLNRSPFMIELYEHLLDVWQETTGKVANRPGELFMHYSFVREFKPAGQASWGTLEYVDSLLSTAYKYQVLKSIQVAR